MSKGKVILFKNAALLTVTSLILRLVGMVFRVWLATAIGAEGMGLYQQIFSVYVFVSVFAASGIGLVVTRLVSAEITLGTRRSIDMIVARSILVCLAVAIASGGATYFFAKPISVYIISDERAIYALKLMSFSLLFMAVSSVLKGYFFARKKALPNSASQLLEQGVRIAVIMTVLGGENTGVMMGCTAVLFADLLAEAASSIYLVICYANDRKKTKNLSGRSRPPYKITKEIMRIVSPIASGKYLNSLLRTIENMLVPTGLAAFGMSRSDALAEFGAVKGMALPLLLFPAGLLSSVTTLLVPEIAEANANGRRLRVKSTTERSISLTFIFSIPFAVIFFFSAESLGLLIYKDAAVGKLIRWLAPLVPLMYVDSVSDALLKSLDFQMDTFKHSLFDSIGRIAAILLLLSRFGMVGFIGIMYASNIFTALLNLIKLIKVSGAKIWVKKHIAFPFLLTLTTALVAKLIASQLRTDGVVYIMLVGGAVFGTYLPYLIKRIREIV